MTSTRPQPAWLADSVLYQIYPQTFADGNGDGIGDLAGATERLDHLAWLGVDAVWFSPLFASPFADAGYDVADYLSVAPRYGTNEDLGAFVEAARRRGIRVLLDLVAGHTSDQHPWFRAWADDPADGRYIWNERVAAPAGSWCPVPGRRGGYYQMNFYPCQPALNFGFARQRADQPWRDPVDAEGPRANRQALRDVMAHWFDLGIGGFRVDMAASLVKDDPGHVETARLWTEMRDWLDAEHPDKALLSEWGDPAVAVPAGFHADFFLHFGRPGLRSLWHTGVGTYDPSWTDTGRYFFDPEGSGGIDTFLREWRRATEAIGVDGGHVALPSANHDYARLVTGPRTAQMARAAFAFVTTWPALPTIYYGDEIGMRYVEGLPDTEGSLLQSTQDRTGSRTPMQWEPGPGAGFSTAPESDFYLPLDPSPDRPDVATQRADEGSLLHLVRRLLALRHATPALGAGGSLEVLTEDYPFVHVRGGTHLVVVNPRREPASAAVPPGWDGARELEVEGVRVAGGNVEASGFSFGIFERV
ncbi:alpha-amylase family glycosyl hydrolase [Arthrobacter sp. NEB 688]|uniref:alpha-amylase family glycosyl hydrolase n=1 Tax=Arthrobacter sp. NEB 688 TaxID=904039 RepID=UPI001564BE24|nr:alpha-amylase family glycosyl hydrolase [Arthrobacter sp. NEB 688]QKE83589.1 oligo-1,6-glucosidase [Arthrobacter sp. NEB 688]